MYEIIFHGRGGQGALLAARILANAYFFDGMYVEAFPHFGGERRGAPVKAFLRVDDKPIRIKTPIQAADCAITLDASLFEVVDINLNLEKEGLIILNSPLKPEMIKLKNKYKLATCDATGISLKLSGKDIPNSAILGAFACAAKLNFESLMKGFKEIFKEEGAANKNIEMAKMAFSSTLLGLSSADSSIKEAGGLNFIDLGVEIGGIYKANGSSRRNITAAWTTKRAAIDLSKCSFCLICYALCPDVCIQKEGKKLKVEEDFCKGCGICEQVCPRQAIKLYEKTLNR